MTTHARAQRRSWALDPWLVASCLTALVVYLLHGFDGELTRDVAVYAYGGQQFAEGVAPYVSISNRVGPLAHVIPGIGVIVSRGIGVDDLLGVRVLFMLISIAAIGLAYLVGRELSRSRLAGVATAATMLSFHGFIEYATYGPREKTPMVLLVLAVFLALTRQRWLTAGILVGLATLLWQPVFFGLLPAVLAAVLLGVRVPEWWRALGRFALGGLIPTALTVGFYVAIGELRVFLDCFVLINARYTSQNSALSDWSKTWSTAHAGYGVTVYVIAIGVVALLVLATVAAVRPGRREPLSAALIAVGVFALGSIGWTLRAYDNWPDLLPLLPPAAIGIGAAVGFLVHRAPRSAIVVTMAVATVCTSMAVVFSIDREETLDKQRSNVATVLEVLPDADIFSVEGTEPLVLAQQRNASRYQLFGNGMIDYVEDTYPGGARGYGRWVDRQEPTLIALGGQRIPEWLAPTLENSYERLSRAPGWTWYARRDLGEDKIEEVREALRARSFRARAHVLP